MKRSIISSFAPVALVFSGALAAPLSAQDIIHAWGVEHSGEVSEAPKETGFTKLACGLHHALALRTNGSVVAWGSEAPTAQMCTGQVSNTPIGLGYIDIAGGAHHSMAIRADGSIETWGSDLHGQISNAPVGAGFSGITAGYFNSLALRSDGSIVAWGDDHLGNPFPTPPGTGYTAMAAGGRHGLALRSDGSLFSWGTDTGGVVSGTPAGTGFRQVVAGIDYSAALAMDGSVVVWGVNTGFVVSGAPTENGFTSLAGSMSNCVALRQNGTLLAWGSSGSFSQSVPSSPGFTGVSAGWGFGLALGQTNLGTSYCLGDGSGGSCPCTGFSNGGGGCPHSVGFGVTLASYGNAFVSDDTIRFDLSGGFGMWPGLILQGTQGMTSGNGLPIGDGLLCVAGTTARSKIQLINQGSTSFTHFSGQSFGAVSGGAGSTVHYQFWYRNVANSCSGLGFNFSNAWKLDWLP
jgi:hypothetical protein